MNINYDEVSLYCVQTADGENHYYDITELNEEMVMLYFWLQSRYGTLGPIATEFPIDDRHISAETLGAKYISKEQAMKSCDKIILRLQNYVTNYRRKWKLAFGVHGKRDGYEALADEIFLKEEDDGR